MQIKKKTTLAYSVLLNLKEVMPKDIQNISTVVLPAQSEYS